MFGLDMGGGGGGEEPSSYETLLTAPFPADEKPEVPGTEPRP